VPSAGRRFRSVAPGSRDRRSGADLARSVRPGCGRAHGRQFSGNPSPCHPDPARASGPATGCLARAQPLASRGLHAPRRRRARRRDGGLLSAEHHLPLPAGRSSRRGGAGPVPGNLRSALVAEEETARFEPALWRNAAVCVHIIEAADSPEVTGSNPAAATSKGPGNRAFLFTAQIDDPNSASALASIVIDSPTTVPPTSPCASVQARGLETEPSERSST
jgi:hypothetical protein